MKNYPSWSCWECGKKHGQVADRISTWHYGRCDVCGENNNVTEPRDFGHFPNWFKTKKGNKMKNLAVVLLAVGLQACSTVSKETYTETREFHYPKGATPHLKDMYMHKGPEVRKAEPVIHQEFNHDITGTGDVPMNTEVSLQDVQHENNLLYAMMLNKMLKGHQ